MRLLIAVLDRAQAEAVRCFLYRAGAGWDITVAGDGRTALSDLEREPFDLLLLHACLPRLDGLSVLEGLVSLELVCPPRVLFLCEPEMKPRRRVDCVAPLCAAPDRLCALLAVLAKKPLPALAAANRDRVREAADAFLTEISLRSGLKGRAYAAWMLERLVPSPALERQPMSELYGQCAKAYKTTPAAVERCLRVAVEGVFTQGSMRGIERFFGATVDPERGKPTNRAFLLQAAQQLRLRLSAYSFTEERSPKSMEMHQSPAAPTIV